MLRKGETEKEIQELTETKKTRKKHTLKNIFKPAKQPPKTCIKKVKRYRRRLTLLYGLRRQHEAWYMAV